MDPNTVVLEISSDEEGGWDDHTEKAIIDGSDDYNWISDILDEVNRENCRYDDDGGDDSDEVVVVSEVLPKRTRKKLKSNSASVIDFDDDCMILDHDPDKPPEIRTDNPTHPHNDDDSDDILVVSEKGQVACRDYPHPRHLCIKFPFASTPNQSHCNQCYCYVCDTLAPCIYWGNGSGSIDHCLATEKNSFWKLERQNSKKLGKDVTVTPLSNSTDQSQAVRPNPVRACPVTSSFVLPNIINQDRSPLLLARSKYQPSLVSQQLTRTSSCTIPDRVQPSYSLATPVNRSVFKRTAADAFAPTTNRYSHSSYYSDNHRNDFTGSSLPNIVNTSVPFSPRPGASFDFPPNFQSLMNPDPYVEVPVLFKPNPVPLSSQAQGKPSLPNCTVPAAAQVSQRSTVDPEFFSGIRWPQSQINHQPAAQSSLLEGVGSSDDPSLASGSGGFVDSVFDDWNCPERLW
ncbi:hypothetical protein SSX86_030706 [Deinandra increscens subsp. villosa]|uniref:Uncharacterized protein n=1 Tax=Deinandra increscens subsp. villosa TaxID=3103831 RepID=A0AAP0GJT7_9ASTR